MLHRRDFCTAAFGLIAATALPRSGPFNVAAFDRKRVLTAARKCLRQQPVTVTASSSNRSAGGKPDFFSEGELPADSAVDEVIRNFFIRQPVLWA